jgi:hypothetical protein
MNLKKGHTFRPHKHPSRPRIYDAYTPQESWVVIRGKVKATLYDTDDTILAIVYLYEGDASFTLHGGHTYEAMNDNTMVYEYKTGMYYGQKDDKVFIDEEE